MRFVLAAIIVMIFIQALLWWPGADHYNNRGQFKSQAEEAEYNRLLKKHGQHKLIAVIFYDEKIPYYFNKRGQKCRFQ